MDAWFFDNFEPAQRYEKYRIPEEWEAEYLSKGFFWIKANRSFPAWPWMFLASSMKIAGFTKSLLMPYHAIPET